MCLRGSWVLSAVFVLGAGCGDDDERPPCNLGNCFEEDGGGGDADGDGDTDADGDGDADEINCTDPDADGHIDYRCPDEGADDCEEGNRNVHPGATEECNGIDDNCADGIDERLLLAGTDVSLASTGQTWLIALAGTDSGYALLRLDTVLDENGDVTRSLELQELTPEGAATGTPVVLSQTPNRFYTDMLGLAASGDLRIAAWGDAEDRIPEKVQGVLQIAFVRDGAIVEIVPLGEKPFDLTPSVAIGTTTALVVWNHDYAVIRYAVVSLDDMSVTQADLLESVSPFAARPTVAWAGDHYLVAGSDRTRHVHVMAIDEDGTVATTTPFPEGGLPSVAWDGSEGLLVYTGGIMGASLFTATPLDAGGAPDGSAVDLDLGGSVAAKLPRLAGGAGAFAVVAPSTSADPTAYAGAVQFAVVDRHGAPSNWLEPDDSPDREADADPWVVPAQDGWAVAWIAPGGGAVSIDFVRCPE